MMRNLFKRLVSKCRRVWAESSSERYVDYLRSRGARVGDGVFVREPKRVTIDLTRPSLLKIGNNVRINRGFLLLTHGYDWYVLRNLFDEVYASSGRVTIGSNVFFGFNVTVLKGIEIGDNCIIGTGSVVTRSIPANSVAAGIPARVICSIDEYREKRRIDYVVEAKDYARSIVEVHGRRPVPGDFREEFPLFLDGDQLPDDLPVAAQLGDSLAAYQRRHRAPYASFDAFLDDCDLPAVRNG
ncbi:acyltransferase [Jeongeupia naejangsanensis]|nr:acyltransferase [Jeongeupia naejangsanensis]